MDSTDKISEIKQVLNKTGQSHLLDFYDELPFDKRQKLIADIEELDFQQINRWVDEYVKNTTPHEVPKNLDPAPYYKARPNNFKIKEKYETAAKTGMQLIQQGSVAGFVVAGGQGTRLGFDGPKGNFPISPIKQKTLFQLFAEYLKAACKRYNVSIPWYVMTSPLNHEHTCDIFEQNQYYGLNKNNVMIFQQGTLPNFDFDGKILLAEKDTIARSPDGHGGSLKALYASGAAGDMRKRGVEYISYWQVDNPLINIMDPLFIGLHALDNSEMSSKALKKAEPLEKVGNFCHVDGKVTVIEYSDLPDEQAKRKKEDGSLVFELGSIGIHLISVSFIEKLNKNGFALPLHRAVKKIPHINSQGDKVTPTEPNGVKLESFVFDALPLAKNSMILETLREQEFAPTKNATGVDSAETSRHMMIGRAADWLESAGIEIPKKPEGHVDAVLEIAPSFALYKDDVKLKKGDIPDVKPGQKVYLD